MHVAAQTIKLGDHQRRVLFLCELNRSIEHRAIDPAFLARLALLETPYDVGIVRQVIQVVLDRRFLRFKPKPDRA